MAGTLLFLLILGGALGFVSWRAFSLRVDGLTAIAAGMFGALVFGFLLGLRTGPWGSLLFGIIGAMAVIWLAHLTRPRNKD